MLKTDRAEAKYCSFGKVLGTVAKKQSTASVKVIIGQEGLCQLVDWEGDTLAAGRVANLSRIRSIQLRGSPKRERAAA
jgi:hypothetical protein